MKTLVIVTTLIMMGCAAPTQYAAAPKLEREFGGIEIGKDFTPLSADVDKAIKVNFGH